MDIIHDDIFMTIRSPNPLEETMDRIAGVIKARLLNPGDRLPPERELATRLGVSRSTLRVALQNLVDARLARSAAGAPWRFVCGALA